MGKVLRSASEFFMAILVIASTLTTPQSNVWFMILFLAVGWGCCFWAVMGLTHLVHSEIARR